MIRTVADFLGELAVAEAKRLAAVDIKHPPMIGGMYEGLTRNILERSLPRELELKVVGGFVVDGKGGTSGQIDCMLVKGEGVEIPYSPGQFQWHVRDVIAVFEVKKNLFGSDLSDGFVHLRGVLDTHADWLKAETDDVTFNLRPTLRAFAQTTGEFAPPRAQWATMDPGKHMILQTMIQDQIAPIRIMFGYGGYSSEYGLRSGFLKYLEANLNAQGFGPPSFPNLIVAGSASLIKLTGHPYHAPIKPNGRWPVLASAGADPLLFILELIWTRISYSVAVAEFFGEDLEQEGLAPLLDAEPKRLPSDPSQWGWMCYVQRMSKAELGGPNDSPSWQPTELDVLQHLIVTSLSAEELDTLEPGFRSFIESKGRDVDEFVAGLVATTLVARKGTRLDLTTIRCASAILPDGRYIAGEDNTGRFSRWVAKYLALREKKGEGT